MSPRRRSKRRIAKPRKGKRKSARPKATSHQGVDISKLNDGYSIAVTAYTALVYALDPVGELPDLGDIAGTLDHGLGMIRRGIDAASLQEGGTKP